MSSYKRVTRIFVQSDIGVPIALPDTDKSIDDTAKDFVNQ